MERSYELGCWDIAAHAYNKLTEVRDHMQQVAENAERLRIEPGVPLEKRNAAALDYLISGVEDILGSLDTVLRWLHWVTRACEIPLHEDE